MLGNTLQCKFYYKDCIKFRWKQKTHKPIKTLAAQSKQNRSFYVNTIETELVSKRSKVSLQLKMTDCQNSKNSNTLFCYELNAFFLPFSNITSVGFRLTDSSFILKSQNFKSPHLKCFVRFLNSIWQINRTDVIVFGIIPRQEHVVWETSRVT